MKDKQEQHEALVQAARDAINAVFSDASVPREVTMESMEELAGDIDVAMEALREDIEQWHQ